ncbi:MAG: hypothetical protein A2176_04065 [Spirochaetes bacterium RBG_13_51_14]|nr:MAG: hypothetical protein A2176_04065 [Spirochaetes bacterium RBG_13_51_14]
MNITTSHEAAAQAFEKVIKSIRQVPITCPENFLLHVKGFNFYGVDISNSRIDELDRIISACEAVENDTWKAQEDFFSYCKKSDLLFYAEKGGQIVGFCLVSLLLVNEYCFYTVDEAMVLRAFQGHNIALNLVTTSSLYFMKKIRLDKSIKKATYVSISANPKVVNNYLKNKYITRVFDNSFLPSEDLINVHRAYLAKYNHSLVDQNYPFCVKNLFPGSQQVDWCNKRYQFCDDVKKLLPPDFDHKERGDAWAFMFVTNIRLAYILITFVSLFFIGWRALFNKKLGLLRRKKRLLANPKLTRVRLIDGKFNEQVSVERRIADRRVFNLGCDANGVDRRISERRMVVRGATIS